MAFEHKVLLEDNIQGCSLYRFWGHHSEHVRKIACHSGKESPNSVDNEFCEDSFDNLLSIFVSVRELFSRLWIMLTNKFDYLSQKGKKVDFERLFFN